MIEQFEMVAKAVSDPNRTRILKLLEPGELCVCQITAVLDLAPATVSKHLSLLKMAGLVFQRKAGRWVYYRIADGVVNPYAPALLGVVRDSLDDDGRIAADRAALARINRIPLDVLCARGFRSEKVTKGRT